jgi:hypothetical protein
MCHRKDEKTFFLLPKNMKKQKRDTMSVKMKVNVSDDGRVDGCLHMMMVKLKAIFARFLSTSFLLFTTRDIFL